MSFVVPIIEGFGEVDAVPALIRRIGFECFQKEVTVNQPVRIKASSFLKFGEEFKRYIELAAITAKENQGFVLIILDCEDDCPATLGTRIRAEAQKVRNDVPYLVCLAYREFETWFLYSAKSLAGHVGLPASLTPPQYPESIRGAKEWLGKQMPSGYKETTHQVKLCSCFSFAEARTSASFDRFLNRIAAYL